jgi:hypothetical protein
MMAGDLQTMDRVIQVIGELDRYHGFGQSKTAPAPASPGAVGTSRRCPSPSAQPEAQDAGAEIIRLATC